MKILLMLFFLAWQLMIVQAQDSIRLSLSDCIDRALASNKQLELASLERQKREIQFNQGRSFLVPQINAYARFYQYLDDRPVYIFPQTGTNELSGPVQLGAPLNFYSGVRINQHLIDARMFGGKSVRSDMDELNRLEVSVREEEIIYEVIKTFYQAQTLEQSNKVIRYNKDRVSRLEAVTRASVESGAVQSTALDELRIRKSEIDLAEQDYSNRREQLYAYMRFLCGIPDETEFQLAQDGDPVSAGPLTFPDSARVPAYEMLELQKELHTAASGDDMASAYPSLDFFAAFEWLQQEGYGELFGSDADWFNQHVIGLRLEVPILNGNGRKIKTQEDRINREIISKQQELLLEKTKLERQKALQDMELARRNLQIAGQKVNLFRTEFERAEVRYEQEFSTLSELLDSEEKYRRARFEEQKSKTDYFIAIVDAYRSYGLLDTFKTRK